MKDFTEKELEEINKLNVHFEKWDCLLSKLVTDGVFWYVKKDGKELGRGDTPSDAISDLKEYLNGRA